SVKKHAVVPRGSVTVVWRIPVCEVMPIGGDEQAGTGSKSPGPTPMGGGWPGEEEGGGAGALSDTATNNLAKSPFRSSSSVRPATCSARRGSRPASRYARSV